MGPAGPARAAVPAERGAQGPRFECYLVAIQAAHGRLSPPSRRRRGRRGRMKTIKFRAILLEGRTSNEIEVPFDPRTRWDVPLGTIGRGRRGHRVLGLLNGVRFEGVVETRARRFFLEVGGTLQSAARLALGQMAEVSLEPHPSPTKPARRPAARKSRG